MNRIQTACYCLIASAFVLGGLLVANLGDQFENKANAELVIARENFTMLTARTRTDEEALFVLDNVSSRLLIYRLDIGRRRIEVAGAVDLRTIFGGGGGGGNTGGGR